MTVLDERAVHRALAEPYAFGLLSWPAVLGMFSDLWAPSRLTMALLGVYLLFVHASAYVGGRGLGFGNAVLLASGCVAGAVALHPSPWGFAPLTLLTLVVLSAQRIRWRQAMVGDDAGGEP